MVVDDPAGLAKLTEKLFGPKSEARKAWFLERTGETLNVGMAGARNEGSN